MDPATSRLSTSADAHHLVVLDEGRIIEQGSPAELLARNGQYAAMVRIDSAGGSVADWVDTDKTVLAPRAT